MSTPSSEFGTIAQSLAMANPETAVGMAATKAVDSVAPHLPTFLMMPTIAFSVILCIIGIIVFSTDSSKVPGTLLIFLSFMLGLFGYKMMNKFEGETPKKM